MPHTVFAENLEALAQRLGERLRAGGRTLPGSAAHTRMAPRPLRVPGDRAALADAAVLVLLYPSGADICLALTRRTDTVAQHRSQVSLPGGRREGEETLEAAALREAEEELAVPPRAVMPLGSLSPLAVYASGFLIHPIVAWTPRRPDFRPCADEVAEIIEVALRELLSPATAREETWTLQGAPRRIPLFALGGHKVWGATAMILSELIEVLREVV